MGGPMTMTTSTRRKRPRLTAEFRQRLTEMRWSLARTVATTDEELATLAAQQPSDFGEGAATGVVGDLLARLEGRERHELDEIDAAQRRLEAGVFGVCEGCHRAIPLARLRALPTARRCATCQAREEAAR
jgi:RNA polymerase-binding transcription factor